MHKKGDKKHCVGLQVHQPGTCNQHALMCSLRHTSNSIKSRGEIDKSTVVDFNICFRDKSLSQQQQKRGYR